MRAAVRLGLCLWLATGVACSDGRSAGEQDATEPTLLTSTEPADQAPSGEATPVTPVAGSQPAEPDMQTVGGFDWRGWRGPRANGTSAETGLLREFTGDGPTVLWRVDLGTGFSGISVAGERLCTLYGSDGRERLACFQVDDGERQWELELDDDFAEGRSFGPRSTPAIDGNRVYAVGASGEVRCVNLTTGEAIWGFNIYDKYSMRTHEEGLSCSPLIDGDRLYLLAGVSAFAFNKSTGELIWRALEERMNHSTPTLAMLDGRRQLVVLSGENLLGLDPQTGDEFWRHPQRAVNCATPVVLPGNRIFVAAAYGFGAQLVRVENGQPEQIYKNMSLATHHATPVLHDNDLYGFHDRPGIFKSIDFATGEENWVSRSPGKGKLILADGQLIILTEYGELVLGAVSDESFTATAKVRLLKGTCYTAPTLANGRLFLRSDQEMVCLNLKR